MFDHTETPKKEYNHWARPDTIVPFDQWVRRGPEGRRQSK